MIAVTVALLICGGATGVCGALPRRRRHLAIGFAALAVAAVAAAAATALAAPAAQGFGLAAVRIAAVFAAMSGGSALVLIAFRLAGADHVPGTVDPADEPLRGGLAIGVLERAAIAVCILANFSAGLAVIVAAKGLARYPELRNPGAAEQFIIGTFVSVLWAAGCAGVAVAISR